MAADETKSPSELQYRLLVGVGGIGTGMFFELEGDHTLGRDESRPGKLLDRRDYCKLHIISHYVAVLLHAHQSGSPFRVLPIGKVGDDGPADRLRREMAAAGMDISLVETAPGYPTLLSVCFQYPDGAGGNITTTGSAASLLSATDIDRAKPAITATGNQTIALGVPEVPLAARYHLLKLAGEHGAFRAAAIASAEVPEAIDMGLFEMVDLLSVNKDEAATIAGEPFDEQYPEGFLAAVAVALSDRQPEMQIIVTAGASGAYAYSSGRWDYCPAFDTQPVSTAGAGDALLAGALAGLVGGLNFITPGPLRKSITDRPLTSAFDLGMLLAAFSVTSPHTIHPDASGEALLNFATELGAAISEPLKVILG